jgi:hypothetical protein
MPAGSIWSFYPSEPELRISDYTEDQVANHLLLLINAGFMDGDMGGDGHFILKGLTWLGHDFLDSVRDPVIWRKTKEGAKKAGGFSLELLIALAKGLLKKQIEEHTGIKLDLQPYAAASCQDRSYYKEPQRLNPIDARHRKKYRPRAVIDLLLIPHSIDLCFPHVAKQ